MEINSPLCITSRLLPGCRIGGADISIEYCCLTAGRQYYRWRIDLPTRKRDGSEEFGGNELASEVGGGTLQEGLESLLGYLGAFAEACCYDSSAEFRQPEACIFPAGLAEWAVENADAITMMELELVENPGKLIIE